MDQNDEAEEVEEANEGWPDGVWVMQVVSLMASDHPNEWAALMATYDPDDLARGLVTVGRASFGHDLPAMKKKLVEMGRTQMKKKGVDPMAAEARRLQDLGIPVATIAKRLDVSRPTVYKLLGDENPQSAPSTE